MCEREERLQKAGACDDAAAFCRRRLGACPSSSSALQCGKCVKKRGRVTCTCSRDNAVSRQHLLELGGFRSLSTGPTATLGV